MTKKVKNLGSQKAAEMAIVPWIASFYNTLDVLITKFITVDIGSKSDIHTHPVQNKNQNIIYFGLSATTDQQVVDREPLNSGKTAQD